MDKTAEKITRVSCNNGSMLFGASLMINPFIAQDGPFIGFGKHLWIGITTVASGTVTGALGAAVAMVTAAGIAKLGKSDCEKMRDNLTRAAGFITAIPGTIVGFEAGSHMVSGKTLSNLVEQAVSGKTDAPQRGTFQQKNGQIVTLVAGS